MGACNQRDPREARREVPLPRTPQRPARPADVPRLELHADAIALGADRFPIHGEAASVCPALRAALIAARRRPADHALVIVADPDVTYGVVSDVLRCARGDANELFTDTTFEVAP